MRPRLGNDGLVVVRDDAIVRIAPGGKRQTLGTFGAARPSGCIYSGPAIPTPDGRGYAYTYVTAASDLFAVRGLR